MRRKYVMAMLAAAGVLALAGCKKEEKVSEVPKQQIDYIEDVEDIYEPEEYEIEEIEETPFEEQKDMQHEEKDNTFAVGTWFTDGYDEVNNWDSSYKIELAADGSAKCEGYRNKDTGYFDVTGENSVKITFEDCETDTPGEGYQRVENFVYTIDMMITGDDAQIKIEAPDIISNLTDGAVHRRSDGGKTEVTEAEKADVADGQYLTDPTYKGNITSDGSTLTIETALSHYDKDWNTVLDYEKNTYVFPTSKNCKCVVYQEEKEEHPIAEQVEFINSFLNGNSELPITLTIKNNELVEMGFSS